MRSAGLSIAALLLLAACDAQGGAEGPGPATSEPATGDPVRNVAAEGNTPPAQGEPAAAAIWGEWVVVDAELGNPDSPVQAYGDAGLAALTGVQLEIAPDEIRWTGTQIDGDDPQYSSFRLVCGDPEITPGENADSVAIACGDGSGFGPSSARQPTLDGNDGLTLDWYDGVVLELQRAP